MRIESSGVLSIDKFVRADSIDPIYYDDSYYLVPDGSGRDAADDVFVVLREAISKTGRMALSRLVIARRERAVALMPMERGIVLHTLHDTREITAPLMSALRRSLGEPKAAAGKKAATTRKPSTKKPAADKPKANKAAQAKRRSA